MEFYTVQFFSVQYNAYFIVNKSANKADLLSLNSRSGGRGRTETQINQNPVT